MITLSRIPLSLGAMIALISLACVLSCTAEPIDAPVARRTVPPPVEAKKTRLRIAAPRVAKAVHDRINRERRRQGLPTFRWDASLGRIAGKHSRDMAKQNYFSHVSPDGKGPAQRYLKARYACGVTINGVLRSGAEVIYRYAQDTAEGVPTRDEIIDGAIKTWTGGDVDRKNILSPHWQREGVGVFIAPDGMVYITVNFC
jgi:uncharacterized protein YkwD